LSVPKIYSQLGKDKETGWSGGRFGGTGESAREKEKEDMLREKAKESQRQRLGMPVFGNQSS